MKKFIHLSEEAGFNQLEEVIHQAPKVNSIKADKMMNLKDEVEANIKKWGWTH